MKNKRPLVQSLCRALDILEAVAKNDGKIGVTELGEVVGLHKSTTYRFLSTFEARGYIVQDTETGKYELGFKILELAKLLLDRLEVRTQARPHLKRLVQLCRETVYLIVLEQGETVYIDRVEGTESLRLRSQIGTRGYAHSSAAGKVLLAYLPVEELRAIVAERGLPPLTENTITDFDRLCEHLALIRKQGFAVDDIENEEDVRCVAAPIRDYRGRVIAAVSISGPSSRMTLERINNELAGLVMDTAAKISADMGYRE